ncbi:MAG TPA: pentapeptide repeat-containing protein, partial [Nocardioides sp.]|nr:pentapeptide repeat-containing protein [Nocardioides sp.]
MATFHHEDLKGSEFTQVTLRGSRFVESDLSGVVIRGSEVSGLEIDAPWLIYGEPLTINGVDVVAYVEAELDRRFPGRAQRQATDPGGLRAAWAS